MLAKHGDGVIRLVAHDPTVLARPQLNTSQVKCVTEPFLKLAYQNARAVSVSCAISVSPASTTRTGRSACSHCSRVGVCTRTRKLSARQADSTELVSPSALRRS